jgi:hypothetical protein
MQLRVGLSFPCDIFDIEKMIEDKIIRLGFLGYNIDTYLFFRAQNFNLWVESFLSFSKKNTMKIQSCP